MKLSHNGLQLFITIRKKTFCRIFDSIIYRLIGENVSLAILYSLLLFFIIENFHFSHYERIFFSYKIFPVFFSSKINSPENFLIFIKLNEMNLREKKNGLLRNSYFTRWKIREDRIFLLEYFIFDAKKKENVSRSIIPFIWKVLRKKNFWGGRGGRVGNGEKQRDENIEERSNELYSILSNF